VLNIKIKMRNDINEAHEASEEFSEGYSDSSAGEHAEKRKVVIPGEVIISGEDFLPGEGTRRSGDDILANKYGLAEKIGRVVKIIPLSGAFIPRRNNVILGRVVDFTHNGWLIDVDAAGSAFMPIAESPRFINKSEMSSFLGIGDMVSAKIWSVNGKAIDLSLKGKGLGKLEGGYVFKINPSRVPRVIGREGSMVNLIKDKTGCNITIGQNGWIWINSDNVDGIIKARKAIEFITERVHIDGLTDKMEEWFGKN